MRKIVLLVLVLVSLSFVVLRPLPGASAATEVKFKGIIDSISAPFLTVSGHLVVADSQTLITQDGIQLTFADLKVGMTVKVTGTLQADGSVLALEIKVLVESPAPGP